MCGIVGAIAQRDAVPVLLEGLRRFEYRGYDSAGVAVLENAPAAALVRVRTPGKVVQLAGSPIARASVLHTLAGRPMGLPTRRRQHRTR